MRAIRILRTLVCVLGACAAPDCRADVFTRPDIITDPDPARFTVCYDGGCASLAQLKLSEKQWQRIRALFAPPAANAAEEREQIRTAIALFETIVGSMTGTSGDKGGTFSGLGETGQMDCIDESTNTTIYLLMLQKFGLLRWHNVADRATRWSLFSWPHTTAVIEERASGQAWAVDSWFLDNGQPPFVLPLETWRSGWKPPQVPAAGAASPKAADH